MCVNERNNVAAIVTLSIAFCIITSCTSFPAEDEERVPLVLSLSPTEGIKSTEVIIHGANFAIDKDKNKVFFNGVPGTIKSNSASELKVTVPRGAGSGAVRVVVDNKDAFNQLNFKYKLTVANLTGGEEIAHKDGPLAEARFEGINGMVADEEGNLFVTDGNYIRKISSDGIVTTIAGNGEFALHNGAGDEASFAQPTGIAIDDIGNLYVADTYNHVIRKVTLDGLVTTLAGGGYPGFEDHGDPLFSHPEGIAVVSPNEIYIADTGNNRIRLLSSNGWASTVAGSGEEPGYQDGPYYWSVLNAPSQIILGKLGELYFTEPSQNMIRRLQYDEVTTVAGAPDAGHVDGIRKYARFAFPLGIALDKNDNLIVADAGSNFLRKITPAGAVTTIGGNGDTEDTFGELETAGLGMPRHLTSTKDGTIYLSGILPRIMVID